MRATPWAGAKVYTKAVVPLFVRMPLVWPGKRRNEGEAKCGARSTGASIRMTIHTTEGKIFHSDERRYRVSQTMADETTSTSHMFLHQAT